MSPRVIDLDIFDKRHFPPALAVDFPFRLRGVITKNNDGDTCEALLDQGNHTRTEVSIRFSDLSAAEIHTSDPVEKEIGLAVAAEMARIIPPDTPIGLESQRIIYDYEHSFTRILGRVKIIVGDESRYLSDYVLNDLKLFGIWSSADWPYEGMPPWAYPSSPSSTEPEPT